jgi:hypothetical protein
MSIPGDELWAQLAYLISEGLDEIRLGAVARVWGTEGINSPSVLLAARHQCPYADDPVEWVLGKPLPKGFSHLGLGGGTHVEHSRRRCEIRNGLQVPGYYRLPRPSVIPQTSSYGYNIASVPLMLSWNRTQ